VHVDDLMLDEIWCLRRLFWLLAFVGVVFRSREVANIRMTQQYRIDIAQLNTTKDSRNSNK
jgi:hypothetical protein